MLEPAIPANEDLRISSLRKLNVLDTPAEDRYDRITRLAKRLFGVPIVLVSLVDSGRQWFKSAQGVTVTEAPREISFCGHAILDNEPLVVENAAKDPRFQDNPCVVGDPRIRFYAGQPLVGPNDMKMGTLCIIDRVPRKLSREELDLLKDLSTMVEKELMSEQAERARDKLMLDLEATKRQALIDPMTRAWNRKGILEYLQRETAQAQRSSSSLGVAMVDIDLFKKINDTHGHPAGDQVISEIAQRLLSAIREYDALGRYGGEEFLLVFPNCNHEELVRIGERILEAVRSAPIQSADIQMDVRVSIGLTASKTKEPLNAELLIQEADKALYRSKNEGRDRLTLA